MRAACVAAIADQFPFVSSRAEWASPYLAKTVSEVVAVVPLRVLERSAVSPALVAVLTGKTQTVSSVPAAAATAAARYSQIGGAAAGAAALGATPRPFGVLSPSFASPASVAAAATGQSPSGAARATQIIAAAKATRGRSAAPAVASPSAAAVAAGAVTGAAGVSSINAGQQPRQSMDATHTAISSPVRIGTPSAPAAATTTAAGSKQGDTVRQQTVRATVASPQR